MAPPGFFWHLGIRIPVRSLTETRPDGPVFRPEHPERTLPDQFRPTLGHRPKVPPGQKLEFYPFHGTLLGESPWADIRKSLHRMGLRASI